MGFRHNDQLSTYTKPFPDHCEKTARATMILKRFLFPGVANRPVQPTFVVRLSSIAALISLNSNSTRGSCLRNQRGEREVK